MGKTYNFFTKLERYNWKFVHYEWAWDSFTPKEKYTLGNQISLIFETPVTAFLNIFVWINKTAKRISNHFSINADEKTKKEQP